jgi:hypothetical protein
MSRRVRASFTGWRRVVASAAVTAVLVASIAMVFEAASEGAQTPAAPRRTTMTPTASPADTGRPPRTPWGDPDLQGIYTSSTHTPLERPAELEGKQFFTEAEAAAYVQARQKELLEQPKDNIHYDDALWQSERTPTGLSSLRTSLVVDPPDGRIPPLTPAAERRVKAQTEVRRRSPATNPESRLLSERCITWRHEGPPMLVAAYASIYQIVQAPGYVVILQEMVHNARIIPLDGREKLSGRIRQYGGESRGRWEGETLVVEVTNFNDRTDFRGSANYRSEELRVRERFTRIDRDSILYQFTVDDPGTWTKPWSAEFGLMSTEGPVFEYGCHEGNYGLANILSAARVQEAN